MDQTLPSSQPALKPEGDHLSDSRDSSGTGSTPLDGVEAGPKSQSPTDGPSALDPSELPQPKLKDDEFYIVGIGASAGGLEALETFFAHVPRETRMAYVVIQHLSPDFKSVMDELLARHTSIPIHRVENGMQVEPDAIYLIPPKKEMIISGGKLLLSDKDPGPGLTLPIDIFFRSLAQDVGPRAIGIILSGTGSDGSRGICDIHSAGGLVFAQTEDSCKFDGMPKSAIETGVVEAVLPPEAMPDALVAYTQGDLPELLATDAAGFVGFDAIFNLLRKDYGIDFSHYKRSTVTRRVQRRLLMHQITDLDVYVDRLRNDRSELNSLYKDLLIGVTKFFRDAEAFSRLEMEVLPQLLAKVKPGGEFRVWVAACATGEEAYSLAILIHEQIHRAHEKVNVKIFATDVHPASLETASAGVYSDASVSEVSPDRLQRYFRRDGSGYHVSSELRQMIVFAPHNIIKDAPFTKLDLITCRNLLIYFEPLAQKKALSLFHFGLNTGGMLMLGPSESPGDLADEFEVIDEHWKVYRKRRDRRLPPDMRLPLSAGYGRHRGQNMLAITPRGAHAPDASLMRAYDSLLESHAPASFLIDERRQLVQSFGGASRYLRIRDGRMSNDVLDLVQPEIRLPLSTALQQAVSKQSSVVFRAIPCSTPDGDQLLTLTVNPLPDTQGDTDYLLVIFEPAEAPKLTDLPKAAEVDMGAASRERLSGLEAELRHTKENLQSTIEELETSNEELQATNEELVASNEELQSTNEELHSVNEELYTVNAEYQKKIAELTELTSDIDNLLHSTEVGVIFLDKDLCIRKFTPRIAETFHLLPQDVGRRIDSFAHSIDRPQLLDDVVQVLKTGTSIEADVLDLLGTSYFLRILPYRTRGKVEGVLLTLIDISSIKRTEQDLRLMSKVFRDGADPIIVEDLNGHIIDLNAEAERTYGWTRDELIGQSIELLIPADMLQFARELRQHCMERGGIRNVETTTRSKHGVTQPVLLTLSLLTDERGQAVAIASIAKDITDRKRAEEKTQDAVRRRDQFLAMLSHELRNPLGAVLNATYLFGKTEDVSVLKEATGVIQRQTLQMARLLDDLLDVSRVTQGKIEMRREVLDLRSLVSDAVHAVQPLINARGHQLTVDVPDEPILVEGDPSRLLQIQINLLNNAARYTHTEGKISLSLRKTDDEAQLRVRDSGKGIAPDMLETIFELFVQGDDTLDRTSGGMGVGLTLVRTLVELHGGRVTASSDGPDRGSEFVVRLPLTTKPSAQHDGQSSPANSNVADTHILVVEDNADSRSMLEASLRLDGYQVTTTCDGPQGLKAILHQKPAIALVDIGLPGMDGYEIARRVREQIPSSKLRLIALTGYGRAEDRDAVRDAGFDAHLVKPLKPDDLARVLAKFVGTNT